MEKVNAGAASSVERLGRSFGLGVFTRVCVVLVEKVMPDPFVIAVLLTLLTCVLAVALAPHGDIGTVVTMGYTVAALTGNEEKHDYVKDLSTQEFVDGPRWSNAPRSLEGQKWAVAIDTRSAPRCSPAYSRR